MRFLRPAIIVTLTVCAVAALAASQNAGADRWRRQREAFARGFNLAAEHPRLAGYVRTLSRALGGPAAFRQRTVNAIPTSSSDRDVVLKAAADMAARRFGMAPEGVSARFASIPKPNAGRIVMRGGSVAIEVSDRHRDDDDRIVAVVAHEFAHAALERTLAGTRDAELAEDESLVDAAAVMVGLGPIMLRASFDEEVKGSGASQEWRVVRIGELDPVAIAYLTLAQAELSSADEEAKMAFIARWMEPPWSFRRTQWERLRPRRLSNGSTIIDCPTCL